MTGIVAQNVGRTSGLIKAVSGGGAWTLIKTLTASANGTLDFVDGASDVILDSTYPIYRFVFINIHPEEDGDDSLFTFNGSTDSGSNYNVTKTTTAFNVIHPENDAETSLNYQAGRDLAQSTAFQNIGVEMGADNDQNLGGYLHLFNPSSTTFVKHFISATNHSHASDETEQDFVAGYFNTTSAIDEIQFKMSSGNIDSGDICLYGLTT